METLIKGVLNKKTLLYLICHSLVFEKSKSAGAGLCACPKATGILTIQTEKRLAAYHQYYTVINRAVESTWK
jgi:type I restriction enzyme R subunit